MISQVNLPEDRGTVFGVFTIIDSVGKAIGPLLGGVLIELLRGMGYTNAQAYEYTMAASTLSWAVCTLIWLAIRNQCAVDRENVKAVLRERAEKILGGVTV